MHPFRDHLRTALSSRGTPPPLRSGRTCEGLDGRPCRLCHAARWSYDDERQARDTALRSFWREHGGDDTLLTPLVPSPPGRRYRTVTKRKVFTRRNAPFLALLAPDEDGEFAPLAVLDCAIEPASHTAVYARVGELLVKPYARALAETLRYVVVRGGGAEQTVILNVRAIDGPAAKAASTMSKTLARSLPGLAAMFLYEDTTDGRYYLGTRSPQARPVVRKIFGRDQLLEIIEGRRFLFSPLAFSQINQALFGAMVVEARSRLAGAGAQHLVDLYCGYGPFALCLADGFRRVTGVDVSRASVEAARANAERQTVAHAGFLQADLTGESLGRLLREDGGGTAVILDPPRTGTAPGVIEAVARIRPLRVVHCFCAVDLAPAELQRWEACGYRPTAVVPFDMFPGTDSVELMAVLQR